MSLATARQKARQSLCTTKTAVRGYAAKQDNSSDPRKDQIRRALYPTNLRNKETPTGGWRPDVGKALQQAIPSVQAHETIERAWKLHLRHQRKRRAEEAERKFECMRKAMDELYEIDPHLYREANKPEDPRKRSEEEIEAFKKLRGTDLKAADSRIRGLFPRELRVPSDTPSREGWNYDWKPFPRPRF